MAYIYHYTTLPRLASIISDNRLKLIRLLDFINLYEPDYFPKELEFDSPLRKQYNNYYISSWTTNPKESISLWRLFCNLETGIRIGIDTDIVIKGEKNIAVEDYYAFNDSIIPLFQHDDFQAKIPLNKLFIEDVKSVSLDRIHKVFLMNTEDYPIDEWKNIMNLQREIVNFSANGLCSIDEVRLQFRVNSKPCPRNKKEEKNRSYEDSHDINLDAVSVKLPQHFFEHAQILTSPNFSKENLLLLKALLNSVNLDIVLQKSRLRECL